MDFETALYNLTDYKDTEIAGDRAENTNDNMLRNLMKLQKLIIQVMEQMTPDKKLLLEDTTVIDNKQEQCMEILEDILQYLKLKD